MAVFEDKEKAKVFTRNRVVDGNKIVRDNRARNAQAGSYGMIRNNATGEKVEDNSQNKPVVYRDIPNTPETPQIPDNQNGGSVYDREMMQQDPEFAGYAQAYERETGTTPTYQQYEDMQAQENTGEPQEVATEEELEEARDDYTQTVGKIMDHLKKNDIDFEEIYNRLPEEIDNETIDKLMDPQKIQNYDDMINVGMAIDYIVDEMNLDTDKFFSTGEVAECGEECKQRNKERAAKINAQEEKTAGYEDRLAMLEEQ